METWSHPISEDFSVKFYFDTNILNFLVDNIYPELNNFVTYLRNTNFVKLVSSNFVILEFIGVRKREHYIREGIAFFQSTGRINFSSLLNYRELYEIPGFDFNSVQSVIESKVNSDIDNITNNFGISFDEHIFHENLFNPTKELLLKTKISNQDSIVLFSALYPDKDIKEMHITVISKDKEFTTLCNDSANLLYNGVFSNESINRPIVENINTIHKNDGTGQLRNLLETPIADLKEFTTSKVIGHIKQKNTDKFLGKTIPCGKSKAYNEIICFELNANTELNRDIYLTVIGKDLNFVYNTRIKINDFHNNSSIPSYPFISTDIKEISFKIKDLDSYSNEIELDKSILDKLRETGNLVFINPDAS